MEKKALIRLLVILLGLSCVVYAAAVPATRSSMIRKMVPLVQDHLAMEDLVVGLSNDEKFDMEKGVVESRMMLDVEDYPRTRPNPAHDPKSPGNPMLDVEDYPRTRPNPAHDPKSPGNP